MRPGNPYAPASIDASGNPSRATEESRRHPGPYLLNVKVSSFECVYPMVPAGAAINEMVLGPPKAAAV